MQCPAVPTLTSSQMHPRCFSRAYNSCHFPGPLARSTTIDSAKNRPEVLPCLCSRPFCQDSASSYDLYGIPGRSNQHILRPSKPATSKTNFSACFLVRCLHKPSRNGYGYRNVVVCHGDLRTQFVSSTSCLAGPARPFT